MKTKIRWLRTSTGCLIGIAVGLSLYKLSGCKDAGACLLATNPYVAVIVWGTLGLLIGSGIGSGKCP